MKFSLLFSFVFLTAFEGVSAQTNSSTPHLIKNNNGAQLIVNGKPFIIMGGELGNSSASSMAYMKTVWPKLKQMNLNTVLAPVYWELLEPEEGKFDFSLVDELISEARRYNLKIVLLWFGTWKNSMSCYVPAWAKTDQQRFPRTENSAGKTAEIITPFSKNALIADKKAFVNLMQHIKATDVKQQTVLMIQVENEIGMLPEARDHSAAANEAFDKPVPADLINYLTVNKNKLLAEVKELWEENGYKTSGTWEEVFGKSLAADELFMAWYFGVYVEEICKAGKQAYNIPMYVNAALNRPGRKPGEYPSAGPLPHVMDIWKASAPSIDFLSPDFYNPDFKHWNDLYTRLSNPLFIPEHRFEAGVDAKAFYAIGHYRAMGFSPFSIESTAKPGEEPLGKAYQLIGQLADEISNAQQKGTIDGVLLNREDDSVEVSLGNYILTVKHDYTLGWSPRSKENDWPFAGGFIIAIADDEFYVAGTGLVITFKPKIGEGQAGILRVEEGAFDNGKWKSRRRLNGDEDHQGRHLRISVDQYDIQKIKLYQYK
jgi:beta-galactosidase GanA